MTTHTQHTPFGLTPTYTSIEQVHLEDLKSKATKIHYFGLGFIQIKLGAHERIHFYTNKLPPIVNKEEVHDHRYDFYSYILSGNFYQETFITTKGDTHIVREESCTAPEAADYIQPSSNKEAFVSLQKTGEQYFTQGSCYYIESNTLHSVSGDEAITFLVRSDYTKDKALVVAAQGKEKVCPFSKQLQEEELWKIVEEMLRQAKEESVTLPN